MATVYAFRVGPRVNELHTFDSSGPTLQREIGLEFTYLRGGVGRFRNGSVEVRGTLDQLERFADILDCTHTLDCCEPGHRRASIAASRRLLSFIADVRNGRCKRCCQPRSLHGGPRHTGSAPYCARYIPTSKES